MKTTMVAMIRERWAATGRAWPMFGGVLVAAFVGCGLLAACVPADVPPEEELDARVFPKESAPYDGGYRCGDLFLESGEQCEPGLDLRASCESLGYLEGELRCVECLFDVQACSGNSCGDGILQQGEECDFGVFSGVFRRTDTPIIERGCTPDCQFTRVACNDGVIAWPHETCDGPEILDPARILGTWRLTDYEPESLACDPETCQVDFRQAFPAVCGNGVLERDEYCDANGQGFVDPDGQRWECMDCQRVDSRSRCGDGAIQRKFGETCEPLSNAWSRWCWPEAPSAGQMECVDCVIVRSDCPPEPPDEPVEPEPDAGADPDTDAGAEADAQSPGDDATAGADADAVAVSDAESSADVGPHAEPESESRPATSGCSVPASPTPGFGSGLLLLGLWAGRRRRG
jgi:hypothetical protein